MKVRAEVPEKGISLIAGSTELEELPLYILLGTHRDNCFRSIKRLTLESIPKERKAGSRIMLSESLPVEHW